MPSSEKGRSGQLRVPNSWKRKLFGKNCLARRLTGTAIFGAFAKHWHLGLGLTILLHTDINFMADEAKLKCPFVTLGVVPEAGSSFLLPHVLGYQRTAELLFSARYMGAKEARETGLVLETLPRAQLLPRVLELATKIAQQPPAAVRETKRLMRHATRGEARAARAREAEEFKARMVSPEFQEAMRAFAEKRAPNFD